MQPSEAVEKLKQWGVLSNCNTLKWHRIDIHGEHVRAILTLIEHAEKPSGQITECTNCHERVLVACGEQFVCLKCFDEYMRKEPTDGTA